MTEPVTEQSVANLMKALVITTEQLKEMEARNSELERKVLVSEAFLRLKGAELAKNFGVYYLLAVVSGAFAAGGIFGLIARSICD